MTASKKWASDAPVSRPAASREDRPVLVTFGGFAFTSGGISHDLSEADAEMIFTPTFAPDE